MRRVFRHRILPRHHLRPGRSSVALLASAVLLLGCGEAGEEPPPSTVAGAQVPEDLDGVWLLAGTDLSLDIDLATATVDARTSCARLLGSLTFEAGGSRTSFSLPGRDDSNCTQAEITRLDAVLETVGAVASAKAEPRSYVLFDADNGRIGTLQSGG